jgi:hypothetical protein
MAALGSNPKSGPNFTTSSVINVTPTGSTIWYSNPAGPGGTGIGGIGPSSHSTVRYGNKTFQGLGNIAPSGGAWFNNATPPVQWGTVNVSNDITLNTSYNGREIVAYANYPSSFAADIGGPLVTYDPSVPWSMSIPIWSAGNQTTTTSSTTPMVSPTAPDSDELTIVRIYADQPAGDVGGYIASMVVTPRRGDANTDGSIDFTDMVAVSQNYNMTGRTWQQGDFNDDGNTDFNDLVFVSQRYNTTYGFADDAPAPAPLPDGMSQLDIFNRDAASLGLPTVPEPTSALVLLAGALICRQRRIR